MLRSNVVDLTGQRFGLLVAVKPVGPMYSSGNMGWEVKCDCGNTWWVAMQSLRKGLTHSCGCLYKRDSLRVGSKVGQLTLVTQFYVFGQERFACVCACGTECDFSAKYLKSGNHPTHCHHCKMAKENTCKALI